MTKKTFISYAFDDKEIVHSGRSFTQAQGGQVQGQFVRVEKFVADKGEKAIDAEIKRVIDQCDAALFVVGNNNHNSPWIKREVELATSKGLKIVIARVPGTTGAIPEALVRQGRTEVSFTPKAISAQLEAHRRPSAQSPLPPSKKSRG
ncbi:TIR domain-containing protein [Rubrivivax sp. A210]|uniref:TIR domain-containing protein n=1 Tax=Rubrivivax sp. A210 TaxID=2772301 RepID=UPI00191AC380|nr:TIR domain-containing protein [Rubrivivax sp. A210]